jgi:hypothetical protein
MRPLIVAVALAMVVATGACWYSAEPFHQSDARPPPPDAPPDARPGPFDCHNQPLPMTAPDRVTVFGTVHDIYPGLRSAAPPSMDSR